MKTIKNQSIFVSYKKSLYPTFKEWKRVSTDAVSHIQIIFGLYPTFKEWKLI